MIKYISFFLQFKVPRTHLNYGLKIVFLCAFNTKLNSAYINCSLFIKYHNNFHPLLEIGCLSVKKRKMYNFIRVCLFSKSKMYKRNFPYIHVLSLQLFKIHICCIFIRRSFIVATFVFGFSFKNNIIEVFIDYIHFLTYSHQEKHFSLEF